MRKWAFGEEYLFSVDHKVIAKQYLFLGLFMGFVGVGLSYFSVGSSPGPAPPYPAGGR